MNNVRMVTEAMGSGKSDLLTDINAPHIDAPLVQAPNEINLSDRVSLVKLSISLPNFNKVDKSATTELLHGKNAKAGVARVNKSIIAKEMEALKACRNCKTEMYNNHILLTQTYLDNVGWRTLCNEMIPRYIETICPLQDSFNARKEEFFIEYQWMREQMKDKLGDLFKESDYPHIDELRSKFGTTLSIEPMPNHGHWGIDMSNDICKELVNDFKKRMGKAEDVMYKDIWSRLHERLTNMSNRLGEYDTKDNPQLYDTMVTHITDMADVMRHCNPMNDPSMDLARIEILDAMNGITKDGLKQSRSLREETKRNVDSIIANLPSIDI